MILKMRCNGIMVQLIVNVVRVKLNRGTISIWNEHGYIGSIWPDGLVTATLELE